MAANMKDQNDDGKVEIKLNRKMRTWNKYKKYIILGGVLLVLVIALVLVLRGCGGDEGTQQKEPASQNTQATAPSQEQQTQTTQEQQTTQGQQATTAPAQTTGAALKLEGTATGQEYVGEDKFSGVTFVGDSIISGFSYYDYISEARVFSDGNLTSDGAVDYVAEVAATNPSKVVLMVGLNDLNYGTRGTDAIAEYIGDFVDQMKSAVPAANVYVVSVLPVTSAFEAGANINITQSGIDDLNSKLSAQAAAKKYNYVDAASAFKDGTGYMNSSFTGNGSNIYNEYYPFLLNGLAGVMK